MLPRSTIVLAVATAIPFGLAIRDTVARTYDAPELHDDDDDDDDDDLDREVEIQQAAADYARYRAQRELEKRERQDGIKDLYGAQPAQLGAQFSSITLGAPVGDRSVESTAGSQLMLLDDGAHTHSLMVKLYNRDDGDCELLQQGLRAAWGEPTPLDNRWIWVGGSQRAVWESEHCALTFEKIAPLELPLKVIGMSSQALLDELGARTLDNIADEQITWMVLGVGVGYGTTTMTADLANGKVSSITAALNVDGITQTQLSEQITHAVGKPPVSPSDRLDTEIWKATRKTPQIKLVEGAPQTFLTIGVRPE